MIIVKTIVNNLNVILYADGQRRRCDDHRPSGTGRSGRRVDDWDALSRAWAPFNSASHGARPGAELLREDAVGVLDPVAQMRARLARINDVGDTKLLC